MVALTMTTFPLQIVAFGKANVTTGSSIGLPEGGCRDVLVPE